MSRQLLINVLAPISASWLRNAGGLQDAIRYLRAMDDYPFIHFILLITLLFYQ